MEYHPWKNNKWFVSPWNYADEVCSNLHFPPNIKIHDVTLRDGEQQAGIVFTKDDKIRIAEALAETGIHRIEAGMPAVSPSDEAAIKEIVKRQLGPQIFAFSRCMIEDVKHAVDCGVSGVILEIPSSEHIIEYAYKWPLQKAIDLSIEATKYAHDQGLEVVFFPIDFTRANIDWVLDLITHVSKEGHMDALVIADSFGACSPHAMQYLVHHVKSRIDKRLEAHFHMDFGLGVANTIMALAEGVEVIHSTILGIGERAGNVPLEETVMALLTMYGVNIGIKYENLFSLSKTVGQLSGHIIPNNRPVVGDKLFDIESGIITGWLKNTTEENITEIFPFHWDLVGQSPVKVVLGKGSGADSIRYWFDKLGISADEEDINSVLREVKKYSLSNKSLLTENDFRNILDDKFPHLVDKLDPEEIN